MHQVLQDSHLNEDGYVVFLFHPTPCNPSFLPSFACWLKCDSEAYRHALKIAARDNSASAGEYQKLSNLLISQVKKIQQVTPVCTEDKSEVN